METTAMLKLKKLRQASKVSALAGMFTLTHNDWTVMHSPNGLL